MHRRDNLELACCNCVFKNLAHMETFGRQSGVRSRNLLHEILIFRGVLTRRALGCLDGGLDAPQKFGQLPELRSIDGSLDGAAFAMAQNNDQLCPGELRSELGAADDVIVDDVASNASAKDIANALVKDQLRRHAGIDAADDKRKRKLSAGGRPYLAEEVAIAHVLRHKPLIAGLELCQGLGRPERSL